jgi:hypothetical protein
MVFGGLSPDIKAVLDRSIGYILPFMRIVNGEMHHAPRHRMSRELRYVFYGAKTSDREKETARYLIAANALNLGIENFSVSFLRSPDEVAEVFS